MTLGSSPLEEVRRMKRLLDRIPAKYINDHSLWSNGYNDAVFEMKGKLIKREAELLEHEQLNNSRKTDGKPCEH